MIINLPEEIKRVICRLEACGYEAYIVGGCVRDYLLGKSPDDIDIATNAHPNQVKECFSNWKVIDTGIVHGTVTVLAEGYPVEITTYRIDGVYSDNRRPDSVEFTSSLKDDLMRRDFTINALAYNDKVGIVGFGQGGTDILTGIIRAVGNPAARFCEDPLRILRGLRFSSVLGFDIEEQTFNAMTNEAWRLKKISAERIASELTKLLCGSNVKGALSAGLDILAQIIPEIKAMEGFKQNNPHHVYDVWGHTVNAAASIEAVPHLRMTMLLHDIGKPRVYSEDARGTGHFYGHQSISSQMAEDILMRLKYDNFIRARVCTLIKYHDIVLKPERRAVKRWMNKLTPQIFFELLQVKKADTMGQNPEIINARMEMINTLEEMATGILAEGQCFALKDLKVSGHDVMDAGAAHGREVGAALNKLLQMVMDEEVENDRESLIKMLQVVLHREDREE